MATRDAFKLRSVFAVRFGYVIAIRAPLRSIFYRRDDERDATVLAHLHKVRNDLVLRK